MTEPVRTTASAGPVTHVIPVTFEEPTHTLAIARDGISIKPGDTVVWTFANAPVGYAPWIQFRPTGTGGDLFGPLHSLHQTESAVWGTCRESQAPGTFSYRAVLQKGHLRTWDNTGSSAWSRTAGLAVISPASGEEKEFTVTLDSTGGQLLVSPLLVELKGADTLVWRFDSVPSTASSWLPRVTFFRYEGVGAVPSPSLGPFTSLITQATQVRGTGNTDVQGLYFFEVALVSAALGEVSWVNSSDPVVDNRGGISTPDGY